MSSRTASALSCLVAFGIFATSSATSADSPNGTPGPRPAVDGLNGMADVAAGSMKGKSIYSGGGLVAIPLGNSFGLELKGVGGAFGQHEFGSAGVNLFWRDPSIGRFGVIADYIGTDTAFGRFDGYHLAFEAAHYFGRFTLRGQAGVATNEPYRLTYGGETFTLIGRQTNFTEKVALDYYLQDNLKLSIGHSYSNDTHAATAGFEWALPTGFHKTMTSFFAEASFASGNTSVFGGLRVYAGQQDKTLIRRHREDDATLAQQLFIISVVAILSELVRHDIDNALASGQPAEIKNKLRSIQRANGN